MEYQIQIKPIVDAIMICKILRKLCEKHHIKCGKSINYCDKIQREFQKIDYLWLQLYHRVAILKRQISY